MEDFKIGDEVEVLCYVETADDAPSGCIGKLGKIITYEEDQYPHVWEIEFDGLTSFFKSWNFTPDQIKLVK